MASAQARGLIGHFLPATVDFVRGASEGARPTARTFTTATGLRLGN